MTLRLTLFYEPMPDENDGAGYASLEQDVNRWLKFNRLTRDQVAEFRMGGFHDDLVVAILYEAPDPQPELKVDRFETEAEIRNAMASEPTYKHPSVHPMYQRLDLPVRPY